MTIPMGESSIGVSCKQYFKLDPNIFLTKGDDTSNMLYIKNKAHIGAMAWNVIGIKTGIELKAFRYMNNSFYDDPKNVYYAIDFGPFIEYAAISFYSGIRYEMKNQAQNFIAIFFGFNGELVASYES